MSLLENRGELKCYDIKEDEDVLRLLTGCIIDVLLKRILLLRPNAGMRDARQLFSK